MGELKSQPPAGRSTLIDDIACGCETGENRVLWCEKLLVSMPSKGYEPDVISYNMLINGYCKTLKVEEAMKLSNEMFHVGM